MIQIALNEKDLEYLRYRIDESTHIGITLNEGAVVKIEVITDDVVANKIEFLKKNNDTVKKIRDIITKDKELNDFVRNYDFTFPDTDRRWFLTKSEEDELHKQAETEVKNHLLKKQSTASKDENKNKDIKLVNNGAN
jgi:hypothetical protein